jgi:peptidoglycan/xylan/chitin deacetylase (PgdA/CDA1 family)
MKPMLRKVAGGVGRLGGAALVRAAARAGGRGGRALIIMYHRVSDEPDYLGLCVTPAHFDRQLALLARSARVLPMAELAALITDPAPLDGDIAAITFDDGYRDNLDVAQPILARHGLPATVFVTTDFVDGTRQPVGERLREAIVAMWGRALPAKSWPMSGADEIDRQGRVALQRRGDEAQLARLAFALTDLDWPRCQTLLDELASLGGVAAGGSSRMLDWAGVRALAARGIEIGSHTLSHAILSRTPRADAEREVVESKQRLERELAAPVRGIAYPNGRDSDFRESDVACARRAGYTYACTTERGVNAAGADVFRLARLGAGDYAGGIFDLRLAVGR